MLRISTRVLLLSCVVAIALLVAPAYSTTITTYSDPTSFQNASNIAQTITFEGLAPAGGSTTYNGATGLTTGNVEFIGYTSAGSWIQVLDTSYSPYYNFGSGDALVQDMDRPTSSSPLPYIHVVLPSGVTAIGMDLFTVSPNALNFQVTVAGTPYTVPTDPNPTEAFFGFTSDTAIASIDLTVPASAYNGGTHALLDNFEYGTAQSMSQAPEATTFLLIGSGLIGIVALRKWLGRKGSA
jgi:hypothetical protein